ncbi:hypothetical protein [Fretibacter rubidus]|uniref:hypothetical protein n=1 Tax=Fretibacter rubidus TaxID=570162 RepID=UPI00352B229D
MKFTHLIKAAAALALCAGTAFAATVDHPYFRAGPVVIVFGGSDFQEQDFEAPIVGDFLLLDNVSSGTAANDIITGDVYAVNFPFDPIHGSEAGWPFEITGQTFGGTYTSNPSFQVLDENDSYSAFGLDDDTDIDLLGNQQRFAWFFVASNAAFDIFAQSNNLVATGDFSGLDYDNIRYRLIVRSPASASIGQASQNPIPGGAGIVLGNSFNDTLDDLSGGPVKVFDGGRKTARIPGTIAQQAVGFASVYNLRGASINGNNYDFSMGVGNLSADVIYTIYAP